MRRLPLLVVLSLIFFDALGQPVKEKHRKQEQLVRAAYEKHKVTFKEFYKLMRELDIIKSTLARYNADGNLSSRETEILEEKLNKAEIRLQLYLTNAEVK